VRLLEAGFKIKHKESVRKSIDFYRWADRMEVPIHNISRLRAMLRQAPRPVIDFLRPKFSESNVQFDLTEAIFVTQKELVRDLDPHSSGR
jgi:hypothetical protein